MTKPQTLGPNFLPSVAHHPWGKGGISPSPCTDSPQKSKPAFQLPPSIQCTRDLSPPPPSPDTTFMPIRHARRAPCALRQVWPDGGTWQWITPEAHHAHTCAMHAALRLAEEANHSQRIVGRDLWHTDVGDLEFDRLTSISFRAFSGAWREYDAANIIIVKFRARNGRPIDVLR